MTDEEIDLITESVSTGEQNFVSELVNLKVDSEGAEGTQALKSRDDLYEQAVDTVVNEQRGSVSLLQRALGIGYGRAARLIDYMEEDGFVGPYNGSKSREVLLDSERWAEMQAGDEAETQVTLAPEKPSLLKIDSTRQTLMAANQGASPLVAEPDQEEEVLESDEDQGSEWEEDSLVEDETGDAAEEAEMEDADEEEYEEDADADYYAEGDADEDEYEEEEYEEYEEYDEGDYEDVEDDS